MLGQTDLDKASPDQSGHSFGVLILELFLRNIGWSMVMRFSFIYFIRSTIFLLLLTFIYFITIIFIIVNNNNSNIIIIIGHIFIIIIIIGYLFFIVFFFIYEFHYLFSQLNNCFLS